MMWVILGLALAAAVGALALLFRHRDTDLGSVSANWLAEQRLRDKHSDIPDRVSKARAANQL
jgi:hypothetical protein